MKKHIAQLTLGISLLLPLSAYAEEGVFALASSSLKNNEKAQEEVVAEATSTILVNDFTSCSQEAIEARDTKIAASRSVYNTAMANALTERKNREKSAIAIKDTDDKKEAIKESVENYKNQTRAAQNSLSASRKTVWQEFEDAIKDCHLLENETTSQADEPVMLRKVNVESASMMKVEEPENKTIKETIKAQFESFKSLFN